MKNYLAKSLLTLAVLFAATSLYAYDFCEENEDGMMIYYNVVSETDKTCEVTAMEDGRSYGNSTSYADYVGHVKIPSYANGYQVTRIGDKAFSCCTNLLSVEIPNSISLIGSMAFYECSGLASVNLPNSVTTIGGSAFYGCSSLTSVTLPNSVTSLGYFAFDGCSSITSLVISNSLKTINTCSFFGCKSLTNVVIPNSVTYIGRQAFQECRGLISVEIPNSVTHIMDNAFTDCRSLSSLSIPSSVTTIGDCAFLSCTSLTSVTLPNSVTEMGDNLFANCSGLSNIEVEKGNPNYNSANNCNAIIETSTNKFISGCKNSVIPDYITVIGCYAFSYCTDLASVEIPNSVTTIESRAFQGCNSLTSVEIPNSVTTIGEGAFLKCKELSSVILPKSVTSIGSNAFRECSKLSSFTSYVTDVFETGDWAFYSSVNGTLYVPKGLVDTYQATADWNRFTSIKEIVEKIPLTIACNTKGTVLINDQITFTNKIGNIQVIEDGENTFVFSPNEGCQLEQVTLNGLDVTASVVNNKLSAKIPANSQMNVVFSKASGDVNGDGKVDVADVVMLVNLILAQ